MLKKVQQSYDVYVKERYQYLGRYALIVYRWLLQFCIVQLYLTLVSLPVMIAWGLPVSLLSPLGNLLFAPFLTIFLCLSTLIFFTELVYFPNQWIIAPLEWVTTAWYACMCWGDLHCAVAFATPPAWLFGALILLVLFLLFGYTVRYTFRTALFLFLTLTVVSSMLKYCSGRAIGSFAIACNKSTVTMLWDGKDVTVIDPGISSSYSSVSSWCQYTLLPEIALRTGKSTIDHLIICKPSRYIAAFLESLVEQKSVRELWIPYVPYYPIIKWCRAAKQRGIVVHYVNRTLSRMCSGHSITLTPSLEQSMFKERPYKPLTVAIDRGVD